MRFARCAGQLSIALVSIAWSSSLLAAPAVIDQLKLGSLNYSATGSNIVNGANETAVDTLDGRRASSIDHLFDAATSTVAFSAGGPLIVNGSTQLLTLGYGQTYAAGGMGAGPATNLNANLSGTQALKVNFGALSSVIAVHAILATDPSNNGNYGFITNFNIPLFVSAPGDFLIPYTALPDGPGGVNLSKIDYIILTFQGSDQFTLTQVSAVTIPEPAVVMWPAIPLLNQRRRRRNRAK